jgi:hypothetical protein
MKIGKNLFIAHPGTIRIDKLVKSISISVQN